MEQVPNNIAYGKKNATEEEIIAAAKAVDADQLYSRFTRRI